MKRSNAAFVMAAGLMVVGCSDGQDPSEPRRTPISVPVAAVQTMVGTIEENTTQRLYPPFILRMDDGTTVGLDGPAAAALRSVLGAQVQVDGVINDDQALEVSRFLVLAVHGSPVLDGVLQLSDDGAFSIRLTGGGERGITDLPADLETHLGERIWLMLDPETGESTATFGVIRS